MDHLDKIRQALEILDLRSLDCLSLGQLQHAVEKNLPSCASKKRILNLYVMWLHDRLMVIDVSAEDAVATEIAAWYRFLKGLGNSDGAIAEAFDDWQLGQRTVDPASCRRLSIAAVELRSLMTATPCHERNVTMPGRPEHHYGHMHPDRLKLSQEAPTVIELDDDEPETIATSSQTPRWNPNQPAESGQDGEPNLSFLTGANRLFLADGASVPVEEQRGGITQESSSLTSSSLVSVPAGPRGEAAATPGKPPRGYLCDRCGLSGHYLKYCPTNMDPTFDRKPPTDYKCKICKKLGDHYLALCPKNRDPNSIARLRRRAAAGNTGARDGRPPEHRDHSGRDSATRSRDGRRSPSGEPYGGRGRSRSPVRQTGGKRDGDKFRPEFERRSRRPLSSPLQPGKHKASRSPSADRSVLKRESRPQDTEHVKVTRKKVTFRDDPVLEVKNRGEGRLSYYDGYDGERHAVLPAVQISWSPDNETMEVDGPEMPASQKSKSPDPAAEEQIFQSFEDDLSEMIEIESAKTDLILLVDGVESRPLCSLFVVSLLKGHEIWSNGAKAKRPCPSDFFDVPAESEHEREAGVEKTPLKEEGTCVRVKEESSFDSGMIVDEPAQPAGFNVEKDMMMADTEPAVAVEVSAKEVDSVMIATGGLRIDETPSRDAKLDETGEKLFVATLSVEDSSETNAPEAHPGTVKQEPSKVVDDGASADRSFVGEAVVSETVEAQPAQSVKDTAMETELTPTMVETAPRAEDDGPAGKAAAVGEVDSTMTDAGPWVTAESSVWVSQKAASEATSAVEPCGLRC